MNWDNDIFTPTMDVPRDALEERAWEIYCYETRGAMSAKDFWWELPKDIQNHFLSKAWSDIIEGHWQP